MPSGAGSAGTAGADRRDEILHRRIALAAAHARVARTTNDIAWAAALTACVLTSALVRDLRAQTARRELVGIVRDSAGAPIEHALVEIYGAAARTDARGSFRLWTADVDTVTLRVRRLGYTAASAAVAARNRQWDTVVVELDRNPDVLAAVTVKESTTRRAVGLREFDERRNLGLGVYVTRDEIVARHTMLPSDILRTTRGVRLVKLRNGSFGVRFALYAGTRPSCVPDLWLDGQRARDMEIDDLTANDIEAIELYESWSTLPLQFSGASGVPCGTIVVWTRVPG
jgi:hypothetical protein